MQQFFLGCTGPHFGPTNTNHAKNYQKITFWALFRIPPQNALQCTTVQCNGLKCKRLNYSLQPAELIVRGDEVVLVHFQEVVHIQKILQTRQKILQTRRNYAHLGIIIYISLY